MTIQISVLVWTVICFCLLMLILNKLLFKPVLAIIDERRAKIEKAANKKAEIEKSQREYEEKLIQVRENFRKSEAERVENILNSAKIKADEDIKKAESESLHRIELAKTDIEFENNELTEKLEMSVDSLAQAFISRLIS